MSSLEQIPIDYSPVICDSSLSRLTLNFNIKFIWMFFIFPKYVNFLFTINNFDNFKIIFFLQNFFNQTIKSRTRVKIKNKKTTYLNYLLLKKKKYLFGFRFKLFYLWKFQLFKKINKIKNNKNLKSVNFFFFNFYKTPYISFFYKDFYPLTGYFLNNYTTPVFSFVEKITEDDDEQNSSCLPHLDRFFSIKKIKVRNKRTKKQKTKNKIKIKMMTFKYFKKLLLNDFFYLSKKKYFWKLFFNKKSTKYSQFFSNSFNFSGFDDLPYSKASLALSLNYKKNEYDIDKLVIFSCEFLLSSFLQFRSFFLKKKKYFRKNKTPYAFHWIFGNKNLRFTFKKKKSKVRLISHFLFKKTPLLYNTLGFKNYFLNVNTNFIKLKNLSKIPANFLKKRKRILFNKKLKKNKKFLKSYEYVYQNKNSYLKLKFNFIKSKALKKKKRIINKNTRLKKKINFFFLKFFFKTLKLKKKPLTVMLNKPRQKSLQKKFKRFMGYLKFKRKSPSATRRSLRILRRKIKAISLRVVKSNFFKFKSFKFLTLLIFKKKIRFATRLKLIKYFTLIYKAKISKSKKKLNFSFIQNQNLSFNNKVLPFSDTINLLDPLDIPSVLHYDFIDTRINFSFTHSLSGFLHLTDKIDISPLDEEYIFHAKKIMHSFLFKNDLENFIIKKHLKSNFNPIFSNFSFERLNYLYTINRHLEEIEIEPTYLEKTHFNFLIETDSFLKKNKKSFFEFSSKLKWSRHKVFSTYIESLNDIGFHFSIKKIKFKPGYQKIWREARECLKTSLNLNFRYQIRLTKFVNRFKKIIRKDTHLLFETQLQNVLKSSKLVPDVNWAVTFLQNDSVFLNGSLVSNPFLQIYKNDFIQFVVTYNYYFFYKWLIVWSTLNKFRFKSKINNKLSKKDLPDDKQKSHTSPSWVLRYRNFTDDAAKNLEIDYLTLSFFVLYEFSDFSELDSTFSFQHRLPVINMYNWKYIN